MNRYLLLKKNQLTYKYNYNICMKVAFIIPIHPKHYNYIYKLIDLINTVNININIYLVFSNEDDFNIFNKKDKIKKIKKIVLPYHSTNNIVVYKKFFALEKLKDDTNYDYFIVCDAEISIIPENFNEKNILNKINSIYQNKIVYAGTTRDENIIKITKTSMNLIIGGDKLEHYTQNYTLYFWWSDLPVYKREYLPHFFSLINYNDINYYHFDHKIYLSYLILHHNFNILNITPFLNIYWSLECYNTLDVHNLEILKSHSYGFSYITPNLYNNHVNLLKNEGSFLLYHLDRNHLHMDFNK